MLVIFWLQWSDAAIKWLALIQRLYMNLVYIQSAHTKGTLLSYCMVYVRLMLVMNSRLKMQTMLPKWLSSRMRVSTEVHLRRQERGWRLYLLFLCCFHIHPISGDIVGGSLMQCYFSIIEFVNILIFLSLSCLLSLLFL